MTEGKNKTIDGAWLSVFAMLVIVFGIALAASAESRKAALVPACYDTGEARVVAVYESGIQGTIEYQYEVQCNNGESYWRDK